MMHGSLDQSISPYKSHFKNRKMIHQKPIISNSADVFWLSQFNSTGHLQPPPPPFLSQSYPPYTLQQSPQPPLLPLPTAAPRRTVSARGLSCPPANQKTSNPTKTRDPSLTPKKSKSPKKVEKNSPKKSTPGIIASDVRKFKNGSSLNSSGSVVGGDQIDIFSGSVVFTISPPPSSLPLPTFSLRPKLGCKAEAAAGIDAGATDDLRRLLRLR